MSPPPRRRRPLVLVAHFVLLVAALCAPPLSMRAAYRQQPGSPPPCYVRCPTWQQTMAATRARLVTTETRPTSDSIGAVWARLDRDFPVPSDWMLQDLGTGRDAWFSATPPPALMHRALDKVSTELGAQGGDIRRRAAALAATHVPPTDVRWLSLYQAACEQRRARRLASLLRSAPRIVFAKHFNMGGSHYAYTEGQSDAQNERHFFPGTALCRLDMVGLYGRVTTLLVDARGVIRDPDVDWDGRRIVFAWKKSDLGDDYHLYDIPAAGGTPRQLTRGLGAADYEPAYLPNGDLVFSSTRCVQTVDCWWTEVSNLYTCAPDGSKMRRLGFDQVHTNAPHVLDDGSVVYTRWEYSDRGQLFVQGLFRMNPDGTGQTAFYANNSWFPTSLLHARGIPGTRKVAAIASGHHTSQAGKLCIVDPSLGTEENEGVRLLAPVRVPPADRVDGYGQQGDQWMKPYPLNEREFLVALWPYDGHHVRRDEFDGHFGIYWMDASGRRELLASDPEQSCHDPVVLRARPRPSVQPTRVDERKATGTYYLQDVYAGPAMVGVTRGSAAKLRVVALEYRAAGIRANGNAGPAGAALVSTPVAVGNGSWDTKTVLGEATIQPDGSAHFEVPARTPVYFQVLDASGKVIQTMRSWSTLQPGERMSCVGCHETKHSTPSAARPSLALRLPAERLRPPFGPGGFSFRRQVQPILDRHCTSCHYDRTLPPPGAAAEPNVDLGDALALSPLEAAWSYTFDDPGGGWQEPRYDASKWQRGQAPFGTEGIPTHTTWQTPDIWLRREFTADSDTAGRTLVLNVFHDEDVEVFINGRPAAAEAGYLTGFKQLRVSAAAATSLRPGRNTLAVHCHQTAGGQAVEVGLYAAPPPPPAPAGSPTRAFSLLAASRVDTTAGRAWSDAYLALTCAAPDPRHPEAGGAWFGRATPLVNWMSPQSAPPIQPPLLTGAIRSGLMGMLEAGHGGSRLSERELATIACWIDLCVPYCGDYAEANAWTPEETGRYLHFLAKRMRLEEAARRSWATGAADGVRIEFLGADDAGLVRADAVGVLDIRRQFRPGDRLLLFGPPDMLLTVDGQVVDRPVHTDDGVYELVLPRPGTPGAIGGETHRVRARPAGTPARAATKQ